MLTLEKNILSKKFNIIQTNFLCDIKSNLEIKFSHYLTIFNQQPVFVFALNVSSFKKLNNIERAKTISNLNEIFLKSMTKISNLKKTKKENKIEIWDETSQIYEESIDIENYIAKLLNWNLSDRDFWKFHKNDYPLIYEQFLFYNTFNISNGSVERKFSIVKHISDWKKNRISDLKIKMRLMLRENFEIEKVN